MMKSFFKKLAFVMALAMVVSMVAPAGAAFADEAGIAIQGTNTIVETYELAKAGATVDFSFKGAPKDWKTTYKWTSSNEAVATVDKAGIVTAVAAGTATITITAGADASYVQTVKVTVKEEKKADAFELAQADLTKFTMTFDAKKDVKVEDVAVVLMINDVEAPIPVKAVSVNENVATVELFSEFINGITYKVTYGKETQSFVGSIGAIDKVAFTYYTAKKGDNTAYVSTEEEPSVTTLVYSLYDANGVDVTSAYDEDELTIEYNVVNESEDYEVIDNELIFYEAGAAVVEVKVTWTSEDGDEVEKVGNGVVVATKRPAISHNLVEAGFLKDGQYLDGAMEAFTGNPDSIFWKDNKYSTSWTLGDAGKFQFAAVVKDNRGNTVATGVNDYGATNWTNDDGEEIYPYGYFKFVTSNDEVVDIDEEGILSFWDAGSASIITYFVDTTGEEEKEVFVGATKLTVSPERYVASYAIADTSATVAAKSTDAGQNLASFVLTARDQYGKNIALKNGVNDIKVETTSTADDIPVKEVTAEPSTATTKSWGKADCSGWWCGNSQGGFHYHITFDGDDFVEYLGTKSSKTVQYAVTVDKEENSKISGAATTKIKLTVKDTVEYAEQLGAFLSGGENKADKFYYSVAGGANVDVVVNYSKNYSRTWNEGAVKSKTVDMNFLNTTNGFVMNAVPGNNIVEMEEDQTTGEAGKLYFEVSAPKDAKNWKYSANWGNVKLEWNDTSNGELKYATTGAYKVTVYYVKNTSSDKLSKLGTYTFNVSNSQAAPKFAGYDSKLGNKTAAGTDAETAIKENLVFTLDGAKIDWTNEEYKLDLTDVVVTDKKIRVNEVTITVPVEDGNDNTDYSYTKKIKVGKTIYFEDAE